MQKTSRVRPSGMVTADEPYEELSLVDTIKEGSVIMVLPETFYPKHGLTKEQQEALKDLIQLEDL